MPGGELLVEREVEKAHHAVEPLPGGRIAFLVDDARVIFVPERDAEVQVVGDAIQVLEEDGSLTVLFSTWDWREPENLPPPENDISDYGVDWTHGNALDYRADRDSLLLSLRDAHVLLEIDVTTGEVIEEYGETVDGYAMSPDTALFVHQHDPNWTPEGSILMVSTDGLDGNEADAETLAVEYTLDHEQRTLVESWSFGAGPGVFSQTRGGARRMPQGNTLIQWNTPALQVWEVTPEGALAWGLDVPEVWTLAGAEPFQSFP